MFIRNELSFEEPDIQLSTKPGIKEVDNHIDGEVKEAPTVREDVSKPAQPLELDKQEVKEGVNKNDDIKDQKAINHKSDHIDE